MKIQSMFSFLLLLTISSLFACINTPGASTGAVGGEKNISCNYLAFAEADTIKRVFYWRPAKDLKGDGPVVFSWKNEDSLYINYGPGTKAPVLFTVAKIKESVRKKIPESIWNGNFTLAGIYNRQDFPDGAYAVIYVHNNNVLFQFHESIGFISGLLYYSNDGQNLLEKAGIQFPCPGSVRF